MAILLLGQYVHPATIESAVSKGVNAYLIKSELGMGIATAVTLACRGWFVATPSVWKIIGENNYLQRQSGIVVNWIPHPRLTPSLHESFELRVMYRMRAPLAAWKIYKSPQTVEKYVNLSYARLEDRWVDDMGLEAINWKNLSPEERAFVLYTQPRVRVVE